MLTPDNLDAFLAGLLEERSGEENAPHVKLDSGEREFIEAIIGSVVTGSKSVFVVMHPDDRLQYMLLNSDRIGAISLLATVMQRTAEALEVDVD